jgi:hypothetical protein
MEELLNEIELPAIEFTTHGESTSYFEPVAAYSSSIVCCSLLEWCRLLRQLTTNQRRS